MSRVRFSRRSSSSRCAVPRRVCHQHCRINDNKTAHSKKKPQSGRKPAARYTLFVFAAAPGSPPPHRAGVTRSAHIVPRGVATQWSYAAARVPGEPPQQ